jgi:hypothetical protein
MLPLNLKAELRQPDSLRAAISQFGQEPKSGTWLFCLLIGVHKQPSIL